MPTPSLEIVPDAHAASHAALRLIVEAADAAIAERGAFMLGLAGGAEFEDLYTIIGKGVPWQPVGAAGPFGRTEFFFTDEACVPRDDAQSHYGMANATIFSRLPLREDYIHRIRGELDPEAAAKEYGLLLKHRFGAAGLDLVLLGMGTDGRTAGLFPHSGALQETHHRVVAHRVPGTDTWHATMTAPFINRARQIILLVTGAEKAACLREVLEGPSEPERLPIQLIAPPAGKMTWIIDAAAAAMVSGHPGSITPESL